MCRGCSPSSGIECSLGFGHAKGLGFGAGGLARRPSVVGVRTPLCVLMQRVGVLCVRHGKEGRKASACVRVCAVCSRKSAKDNCKRRDCAAHMCWSVCDWCVVILS